MSTLSTYAGLIETAMAFGGVSLFVWWQMRVLKRDVAAREAREAAEKTDAFDSTKVQS